ncbi:MAG: hypothetical protein ABI432_09750 [Flavobacteriales bacterium]
MLNVATIRLIGEWRGDADTDLRVRFSWNSLFFLGFTVLLLLIALVTTVFYLRFGVGGTLLLMCCGMEVLICLIVFVPLWIEYRTALRFMRTELGLEATELD